MYGSDYGKIKPWDGRSVSWDAGAAHQGDTLGFPRAQLVLEAQANIMAFLRTVMDKILESRVYLWFRKVGCIDSRKLQE